MVYSIAAVQDWSKRRVLRPVSKAINIFTGKAVHEEMKSYMVENEAVQTALVVRLQKAESRVRLLTVTCAVLALAEVIRWIVR